MMLPTTSHHRRGFALPMVIIVVFVLAAALAAGFSMTRQERLIDDAGRSDQFAQSNAETALQRAITDRASLGLASGVPPANDSIRVTLTNGYADVIVTQVRPAVGTEPAVYLVRAHGYSTASKVAATPNAQYTMTQVATWQKGTMNVKAAFMSLTGIQKNGNTGTISGIDSCGAGASVGGVAVPASPGYTQTSGTFPYPNVLHGSPLIDTTMGATPAAMASNVPVNWDAIVNGGSITPDFTCDASGTGCPTSTWFAANPTVYPIIMVDEPVTSTFAINPGRGMLIIKGNAAISGNDVWNGVVLVGGTVTSNGNNTVNGAIVTGLNVQLGYTVSTNSLGNGTKDFQYNSCEVSNSVASMGSLRVYKNTWSNTYAVY